MAVACTPLDQGREAAWDEFVSAHPQGTFFHLSAWRHVIARAFGHRDHYLLAERDGAITGVLPLVHMKSMLFGSGLVSVPFCVYGGPLAADAESARALVDAACALRTKLGLKVLEFRPLHALPDDVLSDGPDGVSKDGAWQARDDLYVTFRKAIEPSDDANLKAIPRKQRAVVRKAIDAGLTSTVGRDTDLLHAIYAESVRNLGTPVFSKRYFRILAEAFGEAMDVVTILDKDVPVAAVMNFYWRDEVLPYYGGGTSAARGCGANDFMYWEVMRRSAARGLKLFDYGRSKVGTGSFSFKKNWGFAPEPLRYLYRLPAGESIPEINPLNPKYRLFIGAWKKLPLTVANTVGPYIVRGVG